MIETGFQYDIRAEHPRVAIRKEELGNIIARMYGSGAVDPYKTWFNTMKSTNDVLSGANLPTLALLYLATGDNGYKTAYLAKIPITGAI